jgi:predicted nucleotidyltransferase
MRFTRLLDEVLGQRPRVALLRILVRMGGEHTGRELARAAGLDHKTCHTALQELSRHGIIEMRRVGRALACSLNRDHAVVRGILEPAFKKEAGLVEEYASEALRRIKVPLESVVLFGSVARGEEDAKSDVDLLFVVADDRSAKIAQAGIEGIMLDLAHRYGNVPQILVVSRKRFKEGIQRGNPLYMEILKTGRILHGKVFAEVLKDDAEKDQRPKRSQG